jgi:hypothetical protein
MDIVLTLFNCGGSGKVRSQQPVPSIMHCQHPFSTAIKDCHRVLQALLLLINCLISP